MIYGAKKFILLTLLLFCLISIIGTSSAHGFEITEENGPEYVAGLGFPSFGWANYRDGKLMGYWGFNIGLGYSQKIYFNPAKANDFNFYWGWGTALLIWPYINVGGDYIIPIGENKDQYLTLGGQVGLLVPFPYAGLEISYAW